MSQPQFGSSQNPGSGSSPGQVFGDYALLERLSDSKTGAVWRAQHRVTGGVVAVKMLSQAAMTSATMIERFGRQVQIMTQLRHPNLIIAYDGGRLDGIPYLVMEYIEGQDLRTLVKQRGPFSVREAVEYVIQAAAGLHCAHAHGIWHRNVKPGNLLLDRAGAVRVTGFGLAHVEPSEDQGNAALTIQGQAMGTGDYMAPEQTLDARSVDARADVYSLGCTLCMLLTGRPPYRAKTWVELVGAHLTAPIPSLSAGRSDVPPALDGVFQKMLAKRPEDRYASMEEVIAALRESLATSAAAWQGEPSGDLPTMAWPGPQAPGAPPVPSPGLQTPPSAFPPAPQPDLSDVPWPAAQQPAFPQPELPNVLWQAPQGSAQPAFPQPDLPDVAWPTPQGAATAPLAPAAPPGLAPGFPSPPATGAAWPDLPSPVWPAAQEPTMAYGAAPGAPAPPGPLDAPYARPAKPRAKSPRWAMGLLVYGTSAVMGIVLAYFLVKLLLPGNRLP
jgi:serine/threonine protein kinase